jgi:DNA polymerase epsilon subunit 1
MAGDCEVVPCNTKLFLSRIDGKLDLFDDLRDDDYQVDGKIADASEYIIDIREYDVPYQVRVMIDLG